MGAAEKIAVGDYDVKGRDLRQYYAIFTRRALPDGAIWRLALASTCLPGGHPGYMAWMTVISGTERFCPELQRWAVGLGSTVARMKPRIRKNAREFVPSYRHEWGRQASLDGLCMALFGRDKVPATLARAESLGCERASYARVRNFVAGAILLSMQQYEDALQWAHRVARDS